MKLTDEELLNCYWGATLKNISKNAVCNYFGGGVRLSMDRNFDYERITTISPFYRRSITDKLSQGYLLKRIYKLNEEGFLEKNFWGYRIKSKVMSEAFDHVKSLLIESGIPSEKEKVKIIDNVDAITDQANHDVSVMFPNWRGQQ